MKINTSLVLLSLAITNIVNAQTTVLDELNINEDMINSSNNYVKEQSVSLKSPLPALELPKTITTINTQTIEDINATRVDDLYEYVGGVSRKENHGGLWDGVLVRGFSNGESALINGMVSRGYASLPRDLASVERVEFLKRPAGSLYGTGEPGGAINIITKQAHFTPTTIVKAQAGNSNYQRTSLDVNTPLNESAAYRLNLAIENSDSPRTKYVNSNRFVFAPTAVYHINDDVNLEYSGDYIKNNTVMDRGIVMVNGDLNAMNKKTWLGDPEDGDISASNLTHQLKLEQKLSEMWRINVIGSYQKKDLYGFATTPSTKDTDLKANGDLNRSIQLRDYHTRNQQISAEVYVTFTQHELLVGLEKWRLTMDNLWGGSTNPYIINIYNPVYGGIRPDVDSFSYTWETQNNNAVYIQDTLTLGEKWRVVSGLRFDDFDKRTKTASYINGPIKTVKESESAISPSLSVSFLPVPTFSVYSSIGQAFKPNSGTDFAGNSFAGKKVFRLKLVLNMKIVNKL